MAQRWDHHLHCPDLRPLPAGGHCRCGDDRRDYPARAGVAGGRGARKKVLAGPPGGDLKTVMHAQAEHERPDRCAQARPREMNIVPVEHMDQVLEVALVTHEKARPRPRRKEIQAVVAEANPPAPVDPV